MRFPAAFLVLLVVGLGGSPAAAQDGDPDAGREIYVRQCAMCHGRDAEGMVDMHPALRGSVQRLTREGVEVAIRRGRDVMPPMPPFEGRLNDAEIADVIAYLQTLPADRTDTRRGPMGPMMPGAWMTDMAPWMWMIVTVLLALVAGLLGGIVGFLLGRRLR